MMAAILRRHFHKNRPNQLNKRLAKRRSSFIVAARPIESRDPLKRSRKNGHLHYPA
jgi:hypothetical protein